jgi:hypothetical protein
MRTGGFIDMVIHRCDPDETNCNISRFFEKHREQFLAVRRAIEDLGSDASSELARAKTIIEKAEQTPDCLRNARNCRALGDILIALDGIDMDCFAANNDSEWALLAEVLGKKLINPVREI